MRKIVDKFLELAQAIAEKTPTALDDAFLGMVQSNEGLKQWIADWLGGFLPFGGASAMTVTDEATFAACVDPSAQALQGVDLVKLWQLIQLILEIYNQFRPKEA